EHRARIWGGSGPHNGPSSMSLSPNGRMLASSQVNGVVRLFDTETMKEIVGFTLGRSQGKAVAFPPGGGKLLVGEEIWDIDVAKPRSVAQLTWPTIKDRVDIAEFTPDGKNAALIVREDTRLHWWNESGTTPRELAVVSGHSAEIRALAISPDGKTLATGGDDRTVRIWDISEDIPKERLSLTEHKDAVLGFAFSSNDRLISTGADRTIRIWDLSAIEPKSKLVPCESTGPITALAVSSDGTKFAVGGYTETLPKPNAIYVYDISKDVPQMLGRLLAHESTVRFLIFSKDGQTLYSTEQGSPVIRVWDLAQNPPREKFTPTGHMNGLAAISFSPDNTMLATAISGAPNDWVRIWDLTGKQPKQKLVLTDCNGLATFSPDGRFLATRKNTGIWFWKVGDNPDDGFLVNERDDTRGHIQAIRFSPDGRFLAGAKNNGELEILWDSRDELAGLIFPNANSTQECFAFSPDGQKLAFRNNKNNKEITLEVWSLGEKPPRAISKTNLKGLLAMAFSPDGRRLVTADYHGTCHVWNIEGPTVLEEAPIRTEECGELIYAPDGEHIYGSDSSGGAFHSIVEASLKTRKSIRTWNMPISFLDIAISSDGRYLATANQNGTAYILRLSTNSQSK
ncbi:MAG: PD40 domain-containing protein, partial [Planctomycetaceae bacterium]|nr:PD40 domain-containing protein [Planctomycetaceae bacterium]